MNKRVELKIAGMTCVMCAKGIETSLSQLPGVIQTQVNLGTETAHIEYDTNKVKLAELAKVIADSGYEVINEKVVVKIGGMTCAMCVKTIESALKKLDGIVDVNVNLGAEKAYIIYNSKLVTIIDIKKAIEEAGYQYLGVEGEEAED